MKKIEGNSKKTNFTKLTQKGISLIVLVITIIIIVILSTAILVSVVSNNPVMEANKARYDSDTANMQAIFTNTVAKVMAQNRASIEIRPDRINEFVSGVSESVGEVSYTVMNAMDINNTDGTIYFDEGTNTNTEFYTGKKLPIYSAGETKWYVDAEGNISLEVAGVKYGNGETIVLEGEGQTYHTFAPSTLSFRSTADLEEFKEVKINGETIDPSNYTLTEGSTIVTLSIDYLKTLDVDEHEITIVSKNAAPTAKFEVVEPEVNEYNFYYNQPYSAYVSEYDTILTFFLRENGTANIIDILGGDISVTYEVVNGEIVIKSELGEFHSTVSEDGMEIYCYELSTEFILGSEWVVADEDYMYTYREYSEDEKGYQAIPIDKNKATYGEVLSNINNIPVIGLAHSSFEMNKNLTSIPKMPKSIKFTGESSFLGCTGLVNISIPPIYYLEYLCFSGCTNLETVIIEEGASVLTDSLFRNCIKLRKITLPKSVTYIYNDVFKNCTSLTDISYAGTTEEWKKINIYENWNDVPATEVKCSDGVVSLK